MNDLCDILRETRVKDMKAMTTAQYRNVEIRDDGKLTGEHDKFGSWCHFTGVLDLLWISEAIDRIAGFGEDAWKVQDAYGEPGFTPPQGRDWSGYRDSSPPARAKMLAMAVEVMPASDFAEIMGISLNDVVRATLLMNAARSAH